MNKLLLYLLILPFLFFLLTPLFYAYPPGWSDDILINEDTSGSQGSPDVSTDSQNNVWISWHSGILAEMEVYCSKRDSLGSCLIPETNVSNNASQSGLARIIVDKSDNIHFVWRDESPQGFGIWYAKLANDGAVIVPSHLAVSGAGAVGISTFDSEIALNKYQEVNIAWDEGPSGYNQMDYTKLDSLGDTLIAKIQVTPIDAGWVGIGVDSFANNHLACRTDTTGTSNRLTYSKLDKDGNFLVYNKVLATGGNNAIVSDQHQNIHIVYTNPAGPGNRIDYLKLDNDGNILIGPLTISLPQINSNTYAHMAIDSSIVDIMYAKMDTAGNFVISPMKVVYPQGGGEPRIAVDRSNRLHLVWVSGRLGTPDIFYKRGENEPGVDENTQSEASIPNLFVFPNPFTHETKLSFSLSRETKRAIIEIFDILGRKVHEYTLEETDGVIRWQGIDALGNLLPSGVYFIQISDIANKRSIPVVLLR
ncbi:hypothetical protein AMJ52_08620 [candidate division TA06 bacterium DG_78]|uniref:Secretion system C-terminal sorting domain-containing protein n=1 Tax=candidate division TA06 bacterium DG_78 TaxID=1703772 RepID=A0A0S7Y9V1_UNCT6|nr:MAG: hypothetical protein AMJ52_08620 [candidate division TA06 bacterium DG_78]